MTQLTPTLPNLDNLNPEQINALIAELIKEASANDPDAMRAVLDGVTQEIELTSSMWIGGIEPMPFDEFCIALDGNCLFPRQYKVFKDTNLLRASAIFSQHKTYNTIVLAWGKGCVSGSTPVTDEGTGITKTMLEWATNKQAIQVKTWSEDKGVHTAWASTVNRSDQAEMFNLKFADGRTIEATGEHRLRTPNGWVQVSDLVVGVDQVQVLSQLSNCRICDLEPCMKCEAEQSQPVVMDDRVLQTYCECLPLSVRRFCKCGHRNQLGQQQNHFRASRLQNAQHGTRTAPDSICRCSTYCSSPYDEQPLLAVSNDRYAVPSQACVHECSPNCSCKDGQEEPSREYSRPCQSFYPHSEDIYRVADHEDASSRQLQSSCDEETLRSLCTCSVTHSESCLDSNQRLHHLCSDQFQPCEPLRETFLNKQLVDYTTLVGKESRGIADYFDITVPDTGCYFDANGLLSSNSGKDMISAKFICYLTYCMLKMEGNVAERVGLAKGSEIAIMNVAPSEDLARQVFFRPYLSRFINHDLFKPYVLNPKKQILVDEIRFPQIGLTLYSKHSRSSGVDGYSTFAFVLDEYDAFLDSAGGKSNAEDILKVLRSSCNTRMINMWIGLVISYPRIEDGALLKLYEWGKTDPHTYVDKAATWEVNPKVHRNDPGIESDYQSDPADARARYECLPKNAEQAFFEMPEKIAECVDESRKPICEVMVEEMSRIITGNDGEPVEIKFVGPTLLENPVPIPGYDYFLSCDGGLRGDSYAISVFHSDKISDTSPWFCPNCASYKEQVYENGQIVYRNTLLQGATYVQITHDNINAIMKDYNPYQEQTEPINCGMCGETPMMVNPALGVLRWYKRMGGDKKDVSINGRSLNIPHVYEDLLIEIKPFRATRATESNKPVDYIAVQKLCDTLIRSLNITRSRFDPWNSASIVQGLQASTGTDVQEIGYGQADQFKRARIVKAMTYSNLITLLPNTKRDTEWKRLMLKGSKIDHPSGQNSSKDLFDSESVCIWLAATSQCQELELRF